MKDIAGWLQDRAMLEKFRNVASYMIGAPWQFQRQLHGSLFDRGSADSYYGRSRKPHYGGVGGDSGPRVLVDDPESVAEYLAGYEENERSGDKKMW